MQHKDIININQSAQQNTFIKIKIKKKKWKEKEPRNTDMRLEITQIKEIIITL